MTNVKSIIVVAIFTALMGGLANVSAAEQSSQDTKININTASAAELEYLPGLGPSKAQAIVAYRAKRPFKKIEDILRVKGIGRKTFISLRPYLRVSGDTSIKSKIKIPKK